MCKTQEVVILESRNVCVVDEVESFGSWAECMSLEILYQKNFTLKSCLEKPNETKTMIEGKRMCEYTLSVQDAVW